MILLPITAHVAEDNGKFELKRQLSPQVLDGESEKYYIETNLPAIRDIQVASDIKELSQLITKTRDEPPTWVYGATPLIPDIVERLIQYQPINMLGMLQSIWKLLHEKELLLSAKKNVKKLKEPLIRIINMLQFAYHASIVTPEDDEQESEEDKAM